MLFGLPLTSNASSVRGLCETACSYIPDNAGKAVHTLAKVLHERIAKLNEDHGLFSSDWDTWFKSILGPLWNHLKAPLVVTISGVFIILLLYIAIRVLICLVRRLTVTGPSRPSPSVRHTPPTDAGTQHDRNDLFF